MGSIEKSGKLTVGMSVTVDPNVLGHCYIERIEADPDGGGDVAYVRAEKPCMPMQYECEPGDRTLFQFRARALKPQEQAST